MPECFCGKIIFSREVLPTRRAGYNFDFIVGTTRFTASVSAVLGDVKEVFLNSDKIDSDVDLTMRDAAVVISIALQYGIKASEMLHSVGRNADGKPSSPIGAILDILAKMERRT